MEKIKSNILTIGSNLLKNIKIKRFMHEARLIYGKETNQNNLQILLKGEENISIKKKKKFLKNIFLRISGKPISRILGKKEFYSRSFFINKFTLDPRPETETLVESALELINSLKNKNIKILDIGTGTGCILTTILLELEVLKKRKIYGVGIDISDKALFIARKNSRNLGLNKNISFLKSDIFSRIFKRFDVIISNPPYIESDEISKLSTTVKNFDPYISLDGGKDGLEFYRRISRDIKNYLTPGGFFLTEVGFSQSSEVRTIFNNNGFINIFSKKDHSGIERILVFSLKKK